MLNLYGLLKCELRCELVAAEVMHSFRTMCVLWCA